MAIGSAIASFVFKESPPPEYAPGAAVASLVFETDVDVDAILMIVPDDVDVAAKSDGEALLSASRVSDDSELAVVEVAKCTLGSSAIEASLVDVVTAESLSLGEYVVS